MNTWLMLLVIVAAILFFTMPALLRLRIRFLRALSWNGLADHFERNAGRWVMAGRVIVILIVAVILIQANIA
jgi:hypothetical protein